jgi:hypothetical protein
MPSGGGPVSRRRAGGTRPQCGAALTTTRGHEGHAMPGAMVPARGRGGACGGPPACVLLLMLLLCGGVQGCRRWGVVRRRQASERPCPDRQGHQAQQDDSDGAGSSEPDVGRAQQACRAARGGCGRCGGSAGRGANARSGANAGDGRGVGRGRGRRGAEWRVRADGSRGVLRRGAGGRRSRPGYGLGVPLLVFNGRSVAHHRLIIGSLGRSAPFPVTPNPPGGG